MVLEGVKEMWTELPKTGKGESLCQKKIFIAKQFNISFDTNHPLIPNHSSSFNRLIIHNVQARRRRSQSTRTDLSRRCSSEVTRSSWSSKILSQLPDLRKRRLKMDFCLLQKSSNSHVVSAFCNIMRGQAVLVILGTSF